MSNSIKVKFLPKAEYQEVTLEYPFVLEKGHEMYLFVSDKYQVYLNKSINTITTFFTENPEYKLINGYKVSDIETFDNMFVAIQTDIRNIEDSIFEIVLKERNPAEWAMYVADKNEQQKEDNHANA
jgi:hypothetical protein